jgi:hypothetical protein
MLQKIAVRRYPNALLIEPFTWESSAHWVTLALSVVVLILAVWKFPLKPAIFPLVMGAVMFSSALLVFASHRGRHRLVHHLCVCRRCDYIRDSGSTSPCPECGSNGGTAGPFGN